MGERGRYVYAVTRGVDPGSLDSLTGLRGAPVQVVEHRGLLAAVSDVDLDEFGEEGLRRNLEDLAWLEAAARGHDDVVHAVAAAGPTAPLRLATICLDDARVRSLLDQSYDGLQRALDRVEGRAEWSLKVYAPKWETPARAASGAAEPGAGAAYLSRKRTETLDRQTAEQAALEQADHVHEAVSRLSVASRRLQAQDPRLTGHEGTMTLNAAYLVPLDESEEFARQVRDVAAQHEGMRVELNGPWPPYSFATLEGP